MDTRKKLKADGIYIDDADGGALVAALHVESQETAQREGTSREMSADLARAYAAELVRRWNHFPALVEALETLTNAAFEVDGMMDGDDDKQHEWRKEIKAIDRALKLATKALKAAGE